MDKILARVKKPGRYLGCETNATHKDPGGLNGRIALAFPDMYELGMSYLGLQVLYRLVNDQTDLGAERVFAPAMDYERALREAGLPLHSLESRTPLSDFDLIGFSLQHELTYPDVLAMLEMGGVPARACERTDEHPIIIAGGPCATNPEPLAQALDAVVLGDAEPVLVDLVRAVGLARRGGRGRAEILSELSKLPGIYLPGRYAPTYANDGRIQTLAPDPSVPARVCRAVLADFSDQAPPARPLVASIQAVHDRLAVEIQRGCTRGCRFCQAGMINRPVRQRERGQVLAAIRADLACTGYEQVSFLSLSAGDHPQILDMLEDFFEEFAPKRISASLPSLRAETLTPALAERVRTVRKSGFTIAPEAGSARLRRVIQKELAEHDVLRAAHGAFDAGWHTLKLYFMVGLPTETAEDRSSIATLVKRVHQELLAAGHRPQINVGISTFVPKAHTPFQFEPMLSMDEARLINDQVRRELMRIKGVKVTWTRSDSSWAEGVLARGDRRLFDGLLRLARAGKRLCGWNEHFDQEAFVQAFSDLPTPGGTDYYLRERDPDETLPWDHLDLGPSREFLLAERQRAFDEEATPDCATDACSDCGACPEGLAPALARSGSQAAARPATEAPDRKTPAEPNDPPVRIRLQLSKLEAARHMSHLEFMMAIQRALRRADWPLAYSEGYHPKPKLSFGPACPTGATSRAEWLDIRLAQTSDPKPLRARLEETLPPGIQLIQVLELSPKTPGIMADLLELHYRIGLQADGATETIQLAAAELLARKSWWVERQVKGKHKRVELRPSIVALSPAPDDGEPAFVLVLGPGPRSTARPGEVARFIDGLDPERIERLKLIFRPPPVDTAQDEEAP